ncbi:MAG: GGDEF and EAL domain-containing protein [Alphaproteobacteria bacterium]|nr:GGDEF and EAL domain-containing protein [Alphaproteobacteria bacterium]
MLPCDDAAHRVDAALAAAGDVAYEWDLQSDAILWRGPVDAALGIPDRAAIGTGRALAGRIHPADLPQRQGRLSEARDGAAFECEYRLRGADGRFNWIQDRGRFALDETGGAVRMQGVLRVVTARKAAELRLEHLANFDELTGQLNQLRLREAIHQSIGDSVGRGAPGAYLAVGIDNMTMINDAFGFEAADGVIIEVGRRLADRLGGEDVIGRVGGDRFGILLGDCAEAAIGTMAERFLAAISEEPIATSVGPVYITASLGSIAFPRQAATAQDVMTRAETALAEAKRAGRDCAVSYQLTDTKRREHRAGMAVGERVQRALKESRLLFAFQPVVHSASGAVDYYECLLRMREADGSIVAAGAFVPMIEQLGLIRNIDRFVLERAVAELEAAPGFNLGFNISGLTAADHPWLHACVSLLAGKPHIARRVVLEITETTALRDFEDSGRFVKTLRDLGCRVALDDFGAGFTSVRHLQALGVDTVKIDGSFVRNLVAQPESQVFLRHLLGLVHGLGLKTVAECVETAEEMAILRQQGVDFMQGYFFGKPSIERAWAAATPALEKPTRRRQHPPSRAAR